VGDLVGYVCEEELEMLWTLADFSFVLSRLSTGDITWDLGKELGSKPH